MKLRKEHSYELTLIGNADEMLVYFDMPRACTVNKTKAQELKVRVTEYEKQCVTVMVCITPDGQNFPPYIIFRRKSMPENLCQKHAKKSVTCRHVIDASVGHTFCGHLTSEVETKL